eukprot:Protomagalhaensia_sp_Gyna_25__1515@NODE_1778_length_1544_cov_6_423920_g1457_i0_p1_GENE_NODE_1778_length_1544_cov_6_423920_g1457_i0NODE_1778_length_1544_cov_6_423920_g1457_i0_p1_ORF_typecomplete_len433_score95_37SPT2/PF08243_11/5_5e07SPT2/PF08243_11/1_8e04DUF2280/PF10045_9/0_04DNA_pol_phi/PF04931_13/1CobT/PF06213_12/12_NODE_1778_length_1544_cov_6_423920_g1457_i02461466
MQPLVMASSTFRIPRRIPPPATKPAPDVTKRRKLDSAGSFAIPRRLPSKPTVAASSTAAASHPPSTSSVPTIVSRKRPSHDIAPPPAKPSSRVTAPRPSLSGSKPVAPINPHCGATRPTPVHSSIKAPSSTTTTGGRGSFSIPRLAGSSAKPQIQVAQPMAIRAIATKPLAKGIPSPRPGTLIRPTVRPLKVPPRQGLLTKQPKVPPIPKVPRMPLRPNGIRPKAKQPAPAKSVPLPKPKAKGPRPVLKGGVPQPNRPMAPRPVQMARPPMGFAAGRGIPIRRPPFMRRIASNYDPYGIDEPTEEDLAFIDDSLDTDEEDGWRQEMRKVTGYDPAKFAERDLEEALETDVYKQTREEMLSSLIARKEEAEETKRLLEEGDDDEDDDDDDDDDEEEEDEEEAGEEET